MLKYFADANPITVFLKFGWVKVNSNYLYEQSNYVSKHQITDYCKSGGESLYIHNSLSFKNHIKSMH